MAQQQLEELLWLGLDWDGPPVFQSKRLALYEAALRKLGDHVYECFCSRAEVQRASQAPHGPADEGPRYPGTCRALPRAARTRAARPPARRRCGCASSPERSPGPTGFRAAGDSVSDTVGDFVLRRADGIFAYQLAVVVDDAEMGITDVLRGDDLSLRPRARSSSIGSSAFAAALLPRAAGAFGGR